MRHKPSWRKERARSKIAQGLLAKSLAAPEHWLDPRTAAALCWAIAWTTASGTLAT